MSVLHGYRLMVVNHMCLQGLIFFFKFKIFHEVAAPYNPESNRMAEQLVRSLKDRLHHVNKDLGFNLYRNLYIAVSAYWIVPHKATDFSPFVSLYDC